MRTEYHSERDRCQNICAYICRCLTVFYPLCLSNTTKAFRWNISAQDFAVVGITDQNTLLNLLLRSMNRLWRHKRADEFCFFCSHYLQPWQVSSPLQAIFIAAVFCLVKHTLGTAKKKSKQELIRRELWGKYWSKFMQIRFWINKTHISNRILYCFTLTRMYFSAAILRHQWWDLVLKPSNCLGSMFLLSWCSFITRFFFFFFFFLLLGFFKDFFDGNVAATVFLTFAS